MRVYKFLSADFGLKSLWEKRLKITTIDELNDPFDLLPFKILDRAKRKEMRLKNQRLGKSYGMLCFSEGWSDPVIWAHYADKHRGLCLGFEVEDDEETEVIYVDERQDLDNENLIANVEIPIWLYTKYRNWEYEQEIRWWLRLPTPVKINGKDYYFKPFDDSLKLVEVVAGASCEVAKKELLEAIHPLLEIKLTQARAGFHNFEIVQNLQGFREDRSVQYSTNAQGPAQVSSSNDLLEDDL